MRNASADIDHLVESLMVFFLFFQRYLRSLTIKPLQRLIVICFWIYRPLHLLAVMEDLMHLKVKVYRENLPNSFCLPVLSFKTDKNKAVGGCPRPRLSKSLRYSFKYCFSNASPTQREYSQQWGIEDVWVVERVKLARETRWRQLKAFVGVYWDYVIYSLCCLLDCHLLKFCARFLPQWFLKTKLEDRWCWVCGQHGLCLKNLIKKYVCMCFKPYICFRSK